MTFKKNVRSCIAICISAILVIAVCGCEDLGDYASPVEYYASFGDIALIDTVSKETTKYSVEEYFYNKESQENFLMGEDGTYYGVPYGEYVYVAIPVQNDFTMDSIAMYFQSYMSLTMYINVYLTDYVPSKIQGINDVDTNNKPDSEDESSAISEPVKMEYDDPDPETRIGEAKVNLRSKSWTAFSLDNFTVDGNIKTGVQIKKGQYILLQIRNNSGVRVFDEKKQLYVDPQTGLGLQRAEITMTNLLIRALDVENGD